MKKFFIISFVLVIVDIIIKILVQNFLTDKPLFIINNFLYLTYVENEGAAFSILEGRYILLILVGVIAIFLIINYIKKHNYNFGLIMLFSGIIGNLIDRVFYGYVIDYLGFILFNRYMPIFNFADILIVIGAFFVIVGSDKNENRSNN
ncbi:MAG: signal peptidase II [Bacilli bacterium]|nr:signal peptidase II [Bacilli bacterium]MBR2997473.1 signal peptidase II [Bacilli bacterium]